MWPDKKAAQELRHQVPDRGYSLRKILLEKTGTGNKAVESVPVIPRSWSGIRLLGAEASADRLQVV